ncbi:30S ribosomal protein S12 methylthiotransferase RimO [Hippea alviniae]|uniref:30S ribosomal protein S12 methylthiotransferase RimO n=1 Tax=Hippea alviniae TaxID=1279027 RepID=UPI0003B67326|nr:30S ribosomal protein S12 methylthiotransferase RimO [Hippea alviniae]
MKVYLESLGCPKNTADSEYMLGLLAQAGCRVVSNPEDANCLIVNTCGFIQPAKEESIDTILELAQIKKKNKQKLIVCGCLFERYREQLKEELPEVDAFLGVYELDRIVDVAKEEKLKDFKFVRYPVAPKHIGYLKIGDGCSNNCTFCAIPLIKGRFWSKPIEQVVEEAKTLIESGAKEINLVAQDTTAYLIEKGVKNGLVELLKELEKVKGIEWIRLLYTYPTYITDELIDFIASSDKVVHYIDVPFQHASDKVLKDMGRSYNRSYMEKLVENLRKRIPDIAIRSTFIVGFPTETDEEFEELVDFIKDVKLDWSAFFSYYHEDRTKAFEMFDDLDELLKEERLIEIQNIATSITEEKNIELLGEEFKVVVDGEDDEFEGFYKARSYRSAYEIDGVFLLKGSFKAGEFLNVKAKELISPTDILAEKVKSINLFT